MVPHLEDGSPTDDKKETVEVLPATSRPPSRTRVAGATPSCRWAWSIQVGPPSTAYWKVAVVAATGSSCAESPSARAGGDAGPAGVRAFVDLRVGDTSPSGREGRLSMGWRFGEVWLETDVLWFREQPRRPFAELALAVPAVAADGLGPALFMPIATGLEASRQRRLTAQAARRRRLATRTVPAVALVLGSATMLPIAVFRQGSGGQGADAGPLEADPPSLTFRLDGARSDVPEAPVRRQGASSRRRPRRERLHERAEFAPVEWHRATSVGLPYSGRLVDGTQLPVEGPKSAMWNPVTDSVPNLPNRLYGNERTIRTIRL